MIFVFVYCWCYSQLTKLPAASRPPHTHAAAISELGAFYSRAGPRAVMPEDVRRSVLRHLQAAEDSLPKES